MYSFFEVLRFHPCSSEKKNIFLRHQNRIAYTKVQPILQPHRACNKNPFTKPLLKDYIRPSCAGRYFRTRVFEFSGICRYFIGEPQNIEQGMSKAEIRNQSHQTSSFEIPCSTFDIRFELSPKTFGLLNKLIGRSVWRRGRKR